MTTSDFVQGVAYLTVRRDVAKYKGLRAVKVTSKPPMVIDQAGDRVIKLNLRVPSEAFKPLDAGLIEITVDQLLPEVQ